MCAAIGDAFCYCALTMVYLFVSIAHWWVSFVSTGLYAGLGRLQAVSYGSTLLAAAA